jgi:hypothetical protein
VYLDSRALSTSYCPGPGVLILRAAKYSNGFACPPNAADVAVNGRVGPRLVAGDTGVCAPGPIDDCFGSPNRGVFKSVGAGN